MQRAYYIEKNALDIMASIYTQSLIPFTIIFTFSPTHLLSMRSLCAPTLAGFFFCLTEVYVCVCVRQQKQDTYNSIRFNTHCIFTYNVFAMLSLRLLASSPILLPPTFLNAVAVHFSFLFDAVVKHKRMKKCRKCHCIYKYNITM